MEQNLKLPEYIVRQSDRQKVAGRFHEALDRCQQAYAELKAMPDIDNVPTELTAITPQWLNGVIDGVLNEIKAARAMTVKMKDDAVTQWENVRKAALLHVENITSFLSDYPDAVVSISNGEVVCGNADALIDERAKRKTPSTCQRHYELIVKAAEAVEQLRAYQDEHGFKCNVIEALNFAGDKQALIEAWLWHYEAEEIKRRENEGGNFIVGVRPVAEVEAELEQQAAERKKQLEETPITERHTIKTEVRELNAQPVGIL